MGKEVATPQKPPLNPLGVYLLRDAKLYRRIGVHFEMQYNCFRFSLFYSVWPSKYLLFQSSEFFDGILKTFQFVFICFVGGRKRWGVVGFIHVHFVSWTIDPFLLY